MSTFVTEQRIDSVAELLGINENTLLAVAEKFQKKQLSLFAYLQSEPTESFTQEEKDWLLFIALIIFESCEQSGFTPEMISPEEVVDAEEQNWEMLEEVQARNFHDRLDVFFEDTDQEDLLSFIEVALTEPEEEEENGELVDDAPIVTPEAREPMFVMLKTLVDVLTT
jgi:hypothetical protein